MAPALGWGKPTLVSFPVLSGKALASQTQGPKFKLQ
jgi:hypothetical protein